MPAAVKDAREHKANIRPKDGPSARAFEVARSAKYVRGNAAVRVHVVCREERFYQDVPQDVRALGPWPVVSRGEVSELLAEHRYALARQGYVVIEAHMLGFEKGSKHCETDAEDTPND